MLIKCPECGKEISNSTYKCPNCGYRFEKKFNKIIIGIVIAGVCVIIAGFYIFNQYQYNKLLNRDRRSYQQYQNAMNENN